MMLTDLTVLVTGSGGGVGRGIALAAAAAGAHVVVAARGDNGRVVAEEIAARGDSAEWAQCDVTDLGSVAGAVTTALDNSGRLDAIVHNATSSASSQPHQLTEVTDELWEQHVSVSLRGAYHCAIAGHDALRVRGGTMLVMTSPAGIEGSGMLPMYATMKGALRGFAKSLAREWGPAGITVNVVSPLAYSPAMTRAMEKDPPMRTRTSNRIPLGRVGDPEMDVGAAVAFLLGPQTRYITGQTLGIDGGHFTSL